jgi:hypothetical protein
MTTTTPTSRQRSLRSRRRQLLVSTLLIATIVAACAGSDPATSESVETRTQIGPRAIDIDRKMMMVVDSIDASNEDIRVRIRVANLSDQPLDVGVDDTIYGPLLTIRDDLENAYPAIAVEPAGIYSHSIGRFDLRLVGPFDPDAADFTVELATQRGTLITNQVPALDGDSVQWWSETPAVLFPDLSISGQDGRTVRVLDVADRGTHLEVSIEANDTSTEFSGPADERATLTLADGTELESLPPDSSGTHQADTMTGVLRFPGALPTQLEPLVLNIAGLNVKIPPTQWPSASAEPSLAGLAQLPDLVHAKIFNDPLPISTFGYGTE